MTSILLDTVWTLPVNQQRVTESKFYLSSSAIDSVSPWTGERSPMGPFVQLWMAELTFPPAPDVGAATEEKASWRERQGFVTRLNGTSGLVRVPDAARSRPAYDLLNDPTLANWSGGSTWSDGEQWSTGALPPFVVFDEAAHEDDDTIVLRGLPANTALVLSPADLMEARPNGIPTDFGNLYEVVHCARSNADGKARVYLQPGLRQGFAPGDMMVLRDATCVFRLADKGQGIVTRSVGGFGRSGMSLIEQTRHA